MGQIIYSELVNYYHYSEEFIAEYILTNKLTEYLKKVNYQNTSKQSQFLNEVQNKLKVKLHYTILKR
jgi:hypothetical protein